MGVYVALGRWTHFYDTEDDNWAMLSVRTRDLKHLVCQGEVLEKISLRRFFQVVGWDVLALLICDFLKLYRFERNLLVRQDDREVVIEPEEWEPKESQGLDSKIRSEHMTTAAMNLVNKKDSETEHEDSRGKGFGTANLSEFVGED